MTSLFSITVALFAAFLAHEARATSDKPALWKVSFRKLECTQELADSGQCELTDRRGESFTLDTRDIYCPQSLIMPCYVSHRRPPPYGRDLGQQRSVYCPGGDDDDSCYFVQEMYAAAAAADEDAVSSAEIVPAASGAGEKRGFLCDYNHLVPCYINLSRSRIRNVPLWEKRSAVNSQMEACKQNPDSVICKMLLPPGYQPGFQMQGYGY